MIEELKVEKGDKVAWVRWQGDIEDILTVVSVSHKGAITVTNGVGSRGIYSATGYSKGQARGKIRQLKEGEEEKFLERKKAEWAAIDAKRKEEETKRQAKLDRYRKWVQENAWDINSIQTVNCTLYIVSLPIPKNPCTLVLRFDEVNDGGVREYKYMVSIGVHRSEGGHSSDLGKKEYISGGYTSTNNAEIAPLEIAAQWMVSWGHIDDLEGEDVAR